TDTFDTWFSSGQWTLLALGYPNAKDLDVYHPTSVMETGHDLIFKWVPRMVIFALYLRNAGLRPSSRIRASMDGCWNTTPASTAFHIAATG
ncbi:class I tRNA ligase family protein, partial [uncultured Thiodictyon sp.]|uniref:class I tRNA ligase family protein n=1 Tax=uncultured Thiodictyon sp. TaxID=1846217 RepID=UPI00345BA4CB